MSAPIRPTSYALWASGASGNVAEPIVADKAQGFLPTGIARSAYLNWILGLNGSWGKYLDARSCEVARDYFVCGPTGLTSVATGFSLINLNGTERFDVFAMGASDTVNMNGYPLRCRTAFRSVGGTVNVGTAGSTVSIGPGGVPGVTSYGFGGNGGRGGSGLTGAAIAPPPEFWKAPPFVFEGKVNQFNGNGAFTALPIVGGGAGSTGGVAGGGTVGAGGLGGLLGFVMAPDVSATGTNFVAAGGNGSGGAGGTAAGGGGGGGGGAVFVYCTKSGGVSCTVSSNPGTSGSGAGGGANGANGSTGMTAPAEIAVFSALPFNLI